MYPAFIPLASVGRTSRSDRQRSRKSHHDGHYSLYSVWQAFVAVGFSECLQRDCQAYQRVRGWSDRFLISSRMSSARQAVQRADSFTGLG